MQIPPPLFLYCTSGWSLCLITLQVWWSFSVGSFPYEYTSKMKCFRTSDFPPRFHCPYQAELQQQESVLYKERKERERILLSYRKQVEEHKARAERANRRVEYTVMHVSSQTFIFMMEGWCLDCSSPHLPHSFRGQRCRRKS